MAAYRQTCQEMMDRFKATENPETAARVVHTWMMQADSRLHVSDLLRLSAVASKAWPGGEWLQAVTCVRAGQYAEALRLFQLADLRQVPRPRDMLFKAIAFEELGRLEQSERCLDEARDWIRRADEERLPTIDMTIPSWDPWYERSESMKLLDEVESLQSKSSP
jgi:Flp pilus assembly protein TadD